MATAREASSAKRTRFDWWLGGLCASRLFNGLVFMTYAAALPVLQREWEMSGAAAGAVAGGFQLGYALSLVAFSSLADRYSPKRLYLGSLFAGALCAMAFALLARDFASGLVLHTLMGISLGGTYTTGIMIIAEQYAVQTRGMAVGYFIASTSAGYAASLALSGLTLPLGGYRLAFVLTCAGPLVASLLAWHTLRHTEVRVPARERNQAFAREVLGNRAAVLLIGAYAFHSWELLGMWSWSPAFVTACLAAAGQEGAKAAGIGAYITASFHLTGVLASFSMGTLSDRLGRSRVMVALAGMSAACSFVFGWAIQWPMFLVIALGLVYAFTSLGDSPVMSAALTEVMQPAYLGAALGLRSLLGFGLGAVSPLVFGVLLDRANPWAADAGGYTHWGVPFASFGVAGLLAAYCAWRFGSRHELPMRLGRGGIP
jgi:MFS family permease